MYPNTTVTGRYSLIRACCIYVTEQTAADTLCRKPAEVLMLRTRRLSIRCGSGSVRQCQHYDGRPDKLQFEMPFHTYLFQRGLYSYTQTTIKGIRRLQTGKGAKCTPFDLSTHMRGLWVADDLPRHPLFFFLSGTQKCTILRKVKHQNNCHLWQNPITWRWVLESRQGTLRS